MSGVHDAFYADFGERASVSLGLRASPTITGFHEMSILVGDATKGVEEHDPRQHLPERRMGQEGLHVPVTAAHATNAIVVHNIVTSYMHPLRIIHS